MEDQENRVELTEFEIPHNPNEITSIWYIEPAFREEFFGLPESVHPPLTTPEEVESCLKACPNIESLEIHWDSGGVVSADPNPVFGKIISVIASNARKLKTLIISSKSLLDAHLEEINQENFPFLQTLGLPQCHRISAEGIRHVVSQCPELIALDLNHSLYEDSNTAALYIGKFLPELRHLNIHRTCNVLDSGLVAIAEGCPKLEILEAGRNYSLSDQALKKLSKNCHELKFLGMYYNTLVTETGLRYLLAECPHFKCFHHGSGWCAIGSITSVEAKYPQVCFSYNQKNFCVEDDLLF